MTPPIDPGLRWLLHCTWSDGVRSIHEFASYPDFDSALAALLLCADTYPVAREPWDALRLTPYVLEDTP